MHKRNRGRVFTGVLVCVIALSILPIGAQPLAAQSNGDTSIFVPYVGASNFQGLDQTALDIVAQRYGVAREVLEVGTSSRAQFPLQDESAVVIKVVNSESGETYEVAIGDNAAEVDMAALESQEQAIYAERYGKLEPALADLLAADPNATVDVLVWLEEPAYDGPARPDPDAEVLTSEAEQAAYFAQVDAMRADAVAAVVAPVMERFSALGYATGADTYDPVVYASLPANVILEAGQWAEVDTIYLDRVNTTESSPEYAAGVDAPELNIARSTINAHVVHGRGITGSGVRTAQIEVGGRIATANPYLSGTTQNTTYVCAAASSHGTGVAGIVRSTHPTNRGIAPGTTYWAGGSCSGNASQLQNRSTAAADWGARVINLSWGSNIGLTPGANDRFYDSMVINRYRTIVKSAGNEAGPCNSGNGNVTSPGLAYNVITVGNFDDRNTVSWTGDIMSSCSSWRDPSSTRGDREKPEIAAPGTNIVSTINTSPWTGGIGSGTSFAAPMVTGVAALLIQRNSNLSAWPEAIKAILMASATHNIEGSTRLSEFDGAGGIVADRADDIARGVGGNWGAQSYSCSTTSGLIVTSMALTAGVRTRVVIAWDNNPNYSSYASRPSADLDLHILNSAGTVVAGSYSWDNTYEIVDFTPSASGTYRLRVNRFRCDYSPSWLGWAWRRG